MAFAVGYLLLGYFWLEDLLPKSRVTRVKAPALSGVVEYDSMHFSGMIVEECAPDWIQQFAEVKTGDDGRFALPPRDGPVHYVRVSWPGTGTVHLKVELAPGARPLLVRLKPS